jgi:hypothetical protein
MTLPRNLPTVHRLGYEGLSAAMTLKSRASRMEIGIVVPGYVYGDKWSVVKHVDCDPDDASKGYSEIQSFDTEDEARRGFTELAGSHGYDIAHPGYVVAGKHKDGGKSYIAHDRLVDGGPAFDRHLGKAAIIPTITSASTTLFAVPRMKNFHGASEVDLSSYEVHPAESITKNVVFDRTWLDGTTKVPPAEGWSYVVCDPLQTRFATPERHWARLGSVLDACPYSDLNDAVAAMDKVGSDFMIILLRHTVGDTPIARAQLTEMVEDEKQYAKVPVPLQTLEEDDVFRPFG